MELQRYNMNEIIDAYNDSGNDESIASTEWVNAYNAEQRIKELEAHIKFLTEKLDERPDPPEREDDWTAEEMIRRG